MTTDELDAICFCVFICVSGGCVTLLLVINNACDWIDDWVRMLTDNWDEEDDDE